MHVIGSGLGRTGTLSTKAALEQLGFSKCFHMKELFASPELLPAFIKRHEAGPEAVEWEKVFEGYQSCVDFPACLYYKELLQKWPSAKVVHTVRDPESWWKSCQDTIYGVSKVLDQAEKEGKLSEKLKLFNKWQKSAFWSEDTGFMQGKMDNQEEAIKRFTEYTEEVKKTVPEGQLLIFEVKQGWKPLCDFLGVPVPEGDFPRLNDTDSFKKMQEAILAGQDPTADPPPE